MVNWMLDLSFETKHIRDEIQHVRTDVGREITSIRANVHLIQRDVGVLQGQRWVFKNEGEPWVEITSIPPLPSTEERE